MWKKCFFLGRIIGNNLCYLHSDLLSLFFLRLLLRLESNIINYYSWTSRLADVFISRFGINKFGNFWCFGQVFSKTINCKKCMYKLRKLATPYLRCLFIINGVKKTRQLVARDIAVKVLAALHCRCELWQCQKLTREQFENLKFEKIENLTGGKLDKFQIFNFFSCLMLYYGWTCYFKMKSMKIKKVSLFTMQKKISMEVGFPKRKLKSGGVKNCQSQLCSK